MQTLRSGRRPWLAAVALVAVAATGGILWQRHGTAQTPALVPPSREDLDAQQHARGLSRAFRRASEMIVPAVVTVETHTDSKKVASRPGRRGMRQDPLRDFPFDDILPPDHPLRKQLEQGGALDQFTPEREGTGSGVIIDASGVVLTNNHVVDGADKVTVRLSDGREYEATDIRTDPHTDLAIVRIKEGGPFPFARLGDSSKLEIGDWVIAVGAPFGLDTTVSAGIISGKGRELGDAKRTRYLQTDAAINPGNSGGPLVNLEGEVIGINTAIASNSGGYQGIGFAIPSDTARWVTDQLVDRGSVQRAYLGVAIATIDSARAKELHLARGEGVYVNEVLSGSPAADAGVSKGDVITEFAGVRVHSNRELQELVERQPLDSRRPMKVLRDGKPTTLEVVMKPQPKDFGLASNRGFRSTATYHDAELGIEVSTLTPDVAESLGLKGQQGVVITGVDSNGLAASVGLTEGALIQKVGKNAAAAREVSSVADYEQARKEVGLADGVLLKVRTDDGTRFVVIRDK